MPTAVSSAGSSNTHYRCALASAATPADLNLVCIAPPDAQRSAWQAQVQLLLATKTSARLRSQAMSRGPAQRTGRAPVTVRGQRCVFRCLKCLLRNP